MKYRIKELREAAGVTQTELAERTGITRTTIWRLEAGESVVTTTQTLVKIADALNVNVSDLFFDDDV